MLDEKLKSVFFLYLGECGTTSVVHTWDTL
jgi:hypothetical protein